MFRTSLVERLRDLALKAPDLGTEILAQRLQELADKVEGDHVTDTDTNRVLRACQPFLEAAGEMTDIGIIPTTEQYIWRVNRTGVSTQGITFAMVYELRDAVNQYDS